LSQLPRTRWEGEPGCPEGPLKYLFYTETFPARDSASPRQTGIGRYCYDLAAGLSSLGQDVTVFTNASIGPGDEGNEAPFRVMAEGEEPESTPAILRRRQQIVDLLTSQRPDVLLVGDPSAHRVCSLLPPRLRSLCWPIFYGSELLDWERLLRRVSLSPGQWIKRALTRRYLTSAGGTICISRHTAGLLTRVMPRLQADCIVYPTVSEVVLRLPDNQEFSSNLRRRISDGGLPPTILLTVARISERKNQLGVLEAMAHLHSTGGTRFHYVVVGNVDAPQHARYLERMKAFMQAHGLERAVTFVANASDEEKVAYLDACDVFVMLSRTVGASTEGFGISVVEASCRGKPVLVSDQGGMPETVVAGQTGLTVAPEDTAAVAAALAKLARDEGLRSSMGLAGREFTRRGFTPEASARQLHAQLVARGVSLANQ
jgi:glycosyltransferase involved in cell wall biosynthesis